MLFENEHAIVVGHYGNMPHGGIVDTVTTCERSVDVTAVVEASYIDSSPREEV